MKTAERRIWPDIPYAPWRDTCSALHLYTQVVGKYRLSRTPWLNHSWHATLYVDARGLTTGLVPEADAAIEVQFDLQDHRLLARSSTGATGGFSLGEGTVAGFHRNFRALIEDLGGTTDFHGTANEIPDPVPFAHDERSRPYDRERVARFHEAMVAIDAVFKEFRTGFLGKASPVHLFWGSFDLAVTRFSGRTAPAHPGGIPHLPDDITREAYSHEVSSAGFWPGGGGPVDYPAFYSYAYPSPEGFSAATVEPAAAFFHEELGEFLLPYENVRTSSDPEATLLRFLQSTYAAAAVQGAWDRQHLECPIGRPRLCRPVPAGQ